MRRSCGARCRPENGRRLGRPYIGGQEGEGREAARFAGHHDGSEVGGNPARSIWPLPQNDCYCRNNCTHHQGFRAKKKRKLARTPVDANYRLALQKLANLGDHCGASSVLPNGRTLRKDLPEEPVRARGWRNIVIPATKGYSGRWNDLLAASMGSARRTVERTGGSL